MPINRIRIQNLRKEKGLSRQELATEIGIASSALWNIECIPSHNVKVQTLEKISKCLGVSIKELVIDDKSLMDVPMPVDKEVTE